MRTTFACAPRALAPLALALCFLLPLACKAKPSEKACKEAIQNVRRITGQDMSDVGADVAATVRSCRGNSSKKSVECMRTAKTEEDLMRCEGAAGEKYFQEAADEVKANEEKGASAAKPEAGQKSAPEDGAAPADSETPPAVDAEELPAGQSDDTPDAASATETETDEPAGTR